MNERNYLKTLFSLDCAPNEAAQILRLRTRFACIAEFDPVSGKALPTDMDRYLERASPIKTAFWKEYGTRDRLYRVSEYVEAAFWNIAGHIREQIVREHAVVPIHAARELDNASLIWLSRKPGRTIREKLGGKQAVMAVKRRWTIDTLENQLLKAFAKRLTAYLEKRGAFTGENKNDLQCEEMLRGLRRWLGSEDAEAIGPWRNISPNNTLLHDKQYRKIWNAWSWLRRMDDDIAADHRRLPEARVYEVFWNLIVHILQSGIQRIVQQPLILDYDTLEIKHPIPVYGYDISKTISWTAQIRNGILVFQFNKKIICVEIRDKACVINGNSFPVDTKQSASLQPFVVFIAQKIFNYTPVNDILDVLMETLFESTSSAKTTDEQIDEQTVEYAVIDLCSVRPWYISGKNKAKPLPVRLVRQEWPEHGSIDCGQAQALMLAYPGLSIQTVSMRSLFFDENRNTATLGAAPMFIEALKEYIPADIQKGLRYLVPDWINDFAMEAIRKNIHYAYTDAFPLPRSIAAIGAWQSSKKFDISKNGVIVLVIDMLPDVFTVTPLVGTFDQNMLDALPETKGFKWDRHPAFTLPTTAEQTMKTNLYNNNCPFANELLTLFGFDGLVNDAGKLSFVEKVQETGGDRERWYHIPENIRDILLQNQYVINLQEVQNKFVRLKLDANKKPVFVLPIHDSIKLSLYPPNWKTLGSAWSLLVKGGRTVIEWQDMLGDDILFWHDHLPELSIEVYRGGRLERFYLVKDTTTVPLRGKKTRIDITESFTLPAGAAFYRFPLYQGEGSQSLQFSAYLKSQSFPLSHDTECRLEMTYTYGEDMPYKLRFIPKYPERAGFKSVGVNWIPQADDDILLNVPAPPFPERETWDMFREYPKKDGADTSDILNWCTTSLQAMDILTMGDNRKTGYFKRGNIDKNGKYYCFVTTDGKDVFCHSSNFIEQADPELFYEGMPCYLEIESTPDGRFQGKRISFTQRIPIKWITKKIRDARFPVITIWNQHSLAEPDAPRDFHDAVFKAQQTITGLLQRDDIPGSLKYELFYILCCMHKDAPGDLISAKLLPLFNGQDVKDMGRFSKNIGFAIGDAKLDWQEELFNNTIDLILKEKFAGVAFTILSIAFWRSESLIHKIDIRQLQSITVLLRNFLGKDINKINIASDEKKWYLQNMTQHLELLLALLRTRASNDENIRQFFMPQKEPTVTLLRILDDLNDLPINSRLKLSGINKPESLYHTPDLIYALRLYLTGDSGAHQISIKVEDE